MAYPPPPYADAVCGEPLCGEAICGVSWAYPAQSGLALGGVNPALVITEAGIVSPAGLALGAYPPTAQIIPAVQPAGLGLGAYKPIIPEHVSVPETGLGLGTVPPIFRISQIAHPPEAGLGLGAYLPEAEIEWLHPSGCIDLPLQPVVCAPLVLAPAACTDLPLEPAEVR